MAAKKGLGSGVNSLFGNYVDVDLKKGVVEIEINRIEPNRNQPRKYFDEESIKELAESIKEFGIIQPLIVSEENGYYKIIAGERRWRAAREAKLQNVPVIIKNYNELETLQIALIENIQRKDLNPIEEATCFKRLIDEFFFTQEDIAKRIGRSRNTISYSVNLLTLDQQIQEYLIEGKLTVGHGRALIPLPNDLQAELASKIIDEQLSVREAEELVKRINGGTAEKINAQAKKEPDSSYKNVEDQLKTIFGTKVTIKDGNKKGKIEIEYYSPEELDKIICMLNRAN